MALNRLDSPKPGVLTPRRGTLLASVAALGATMLLAGPGGYQPSGLTSPARATETMAQHPASFADVVAKVKPAVISVRVKVNAAAETGLMEQNDTRTRIRSIRIRRCTSSSGSFLQRACPVRGNALR
jgi:serine protease Do